MLRSAAALLVFFFAQQLHAQAIDCPAAPGSPVSLEAVPSGAFAYYAAVGSASIVQPFVLKDVQGRGVRAPEVEVTLPDQPVSLVFASAGSPKRVVVQVPSGCLVYPPGILAGPDAGTFTATARAMGAAFSIPIHVINTQSYVHRTFPDEVIATSAMPIPANSPSSSVTVSASAEWSDGVGHYGPLGGVPMTFTAPSSGPTLVFANGTQRITVNSNSSGGVGAIASTTGGTGPFIVRVTYPDGGLAMVWRYAAIAAPEVQLASPPAIDYGVRTELQGSARMAGFPCNLQFNNVLSMGMTVSSLGARLSTSGLRGFGGTCADDVFQAPFTYSTLGLPFGTWPITAEVADRNRTLASGQATTSVTVLAARTVQTSTGRGAVRLGASDPGYFLAAGNCAVTAAQAVAIGSADFPPVRPDAPELPFGAIRIELGNCSNWRSTTDFGIQPLPPPITQRILLETDEDLPAGTVAFAYGPTPDNWAPHWHELRTSVTGRFAQFDVTNGSTGDDSTAADQVIRPLIALGVPTRTNYQDLWWAGAAENGWGMSLTQHRDALFAALFVYDAQGDPRWLVMSGGAWNAARTVYTGEVYRPRGTPFAQDGTSFTPGAAVGTLRLTPLDSGTMRIDYTIDGVSGTKQVTRQPFGPVHPHPTPRLDDLWWGGLAQNGWGFALAQQYRTFFGVIYTYDANGDTTWYVAPAGSLQPGSQVVESMLYQTRGSPWLGAAYDPSRLAVTPVGTMRMSVRDGWESAFLSVLFDRALPVYKNISRQPF